MGGFNIQKSFKESKVASRASFPYLDIAGPEYATASTNLVNTELYISPKK